MMAMGTGANCHDRAPITLHPAAHNYEAETVRGEARESRGVVSEVHIECLGPANICYGPMGALPPHLESLVKG